MTTMATSRSDAIKGDVLEAIYALGGRVEGADIDDIKQQLGMFGLSNKVLSSALWKLVVQDGRLAFTSQRDWEGCDPRGYNPITKRIYKIRR